MTSLIRWVYRRVGLELRCSRGENDEQRLEYWYLPPCPPPRLEYLPPPPASSTGTCPHLGSLMTSDDL